MCTGYNILRETSVIKLKKSNEKRQYLHFVCIGLIFNMVVHIKQITENKLHIFVYCKKVQYKTQTEPNSKNQNIDQMTQTYVIFFLTIKSLHTFH